MLACRASGLSLLAPAILPGGHEHVTPRCNLPRVWTVSPRARHTSRRARARIPVTKAAHTTCCAPEKTVSRTRLRYMVECGQCGAAHTTCCEAVRHLPAINSDIWLMAGQQPVTNPVSRTQCIFPRSASIYGRARAAPRLSPEPPRLRGGEPAAGVTCLK